MHPRPQLTPAEQAFLRAWMWEEAHPRVIENGAKKTQIDRSPYAAPLLADIAAATMTPEEQLGAAHGARPARIPVWPWASDEDFRFRHEEAKAWLEGSRFRHTPER
jgi:hypothetical protein